MAFSLSGFLKGIVISNEIDRSKQLIVQISPSASTATATTLVASQTGNRTLTLPDISDTVSTSSLTETLTNKTIDGANNTISDISISSLATVLADENNFLVRDASGNVISNTKAVPTGTVVGTSDTQTLTNKSIDATTNTLTNIANASIASGAAIAVNKLAAQTASRAVATDASGFLTPSTTTATELGFVSGVTSSIQTQINSKTTLTGTLVDNEVLRADGTANVQGSTLVLDDSGNLTNVHSITTDNLGLVISGNTVSSSNNDSLNLTTNLGNQVILANRQFIVGSPGASVPGQLVIRQDPAINNNAVTIQAGPTLAANRTLTLPDATTTIVGTDATQTLTNKTIGDATTYAEVATPSNPASTFVKLYFKNDGHLYSLNSTGTETQIDAAGAALTGLQSRNLLLNSAFDLWQRGLSTVVTGGENFMADRWYCSNTTTGSVTYSQVTGTLAGSAFGAQLKVTSAGTTGTYRLVHLLENKDAITIYNQIVSGAINVKALGNINQAKLSICYTTNDTSHPVLTGSQTIASTTATVNSSTFTLIKLENVNISTLPTTAGRVALVIEASGTSTGNIWDLNNGIILEQAILNVGSTAKNFNRALPSYSEELKACERYFEKSSFPNIFFGDATSSWPGAFQYNANATLQQFWTVPFKTRKRATAAVNVWNPQNGANGNAADRSAGSSVVISVSDAGDNSFVWTQFSATSNHQYAAHWIADAEV